jgi:hypothetical protein
MATVRVNLPIVLDVADEDLAVAQGIAEVVQVMRSAPVRDACASLARSLEAQVAARRARRERR